MKKLILLSVLALPFTAKADFSDNCALISDFAGSVMAHRQNKVPVAVLMKFSDDSFKGKFDVLAKEIITEAYATKVFSELIKKHAIELHKDRYFTLCVKGFLDE